MPLGVTVSVAEGEPSPSAHELFSVYFVGQERTWFTSDAGESQDSGRLWDRGRVSGRGGTPPRWSGRPCCTDMVLLPSSTWCPMPSADHASAGTTHPSPWMEGGNHPTRWPAASSIPMACAGPGFWGRAECTRAPKLLVRLRQVDGLGPWGC